MALSTLIGADVALLRRIRQALPALAVGEFDRALRDLFVPEAVRAVFFHYVDDGGGRVVVAEERGGAFGAFFAELEERSRMTTLACRSDHHTWCTMTAERAKQVNDDAAKETPGLFHR